MTISVNTSASALAVGILTAISAPTPAHAYPIDCAILLCMAGGFPPSAECAAAKAEVIRRITPYPVEPPLQIWNCPMGASYAPTTEQTPMMRLYKATARSVSIPLPAFRPDAQLWTVQDNPTENGRADIDISGPAFAFARSIEVWHLWSYRHIPAGEDNTCKETSSITLGSYGSQGQYLWNKVSLSDLPSWFELDRGCRSGNWQNNRIGLSWRDHEGNLSYEIVDY